MADYAPEAKNADDVEQEPKEGQPVGQEAVADADSGATNDAITVVGGGDATAVDPKAGGDVSEAGGPTTLEQEGEEAASVAKLAVETAAGEGDREKLEKKIDAEAEEKLREQPDDEMVGVPATIGAAASSEAAAHPGMEAATPSGGEVEEEKPEERAKDKSEEQPDVEMALEETRPKGGDTNAVRKKPMTPVFAFIQEKRAEIAAMPGVKGVGEISKKGAELFKALPEAEQAERKKRFEKELDSYKEWAATEEGQAAMATKREAAAEQREAKKEKEVRKQAKLAGKRGQPTSTAAAAETPKTKKSRSGQGQNAITPPPPAAKSGHRGRDSAASASATPAIDPDVLKQAQGLALESALMNLAARKEVAESGKSSKAMLQALQQSKGLVNSAKRALLGA